MARLRRRRESSRQGTWRQALLFNSLLLLLAVLGARIMTNAYTAESVGDVPDIQAKTETRRAIDESFQTIVPKGNVARAFWADQISRELAARDFSAARGYLLAAPVMLERDDGRAILAAADAEEAGSQDQRLVKAALLFLPNETRAEYERAIEPPRIEMDTSGEDGGIPSDDDMTDRADTDAAGDASEAGPAPDGAGEDGAGEEVPDEDLYAPRRASAFSMVGDRTDLVRRAQRWINGDAVDSMQIRLSAIGLVSLPGARDDLDYARAISVLKAAGRAKRLRPDYREYLTDRIDLAMPEERAFATVRDALAQVAPMSQLEDMVIAAFEETIVPEGLRRLESDLQAIDRIAALTSPSGAVTLLETADSPEDVRKLQLIAEAGGDRAVALTKQIGPRVLKLAQIGIKWSLNLALQIMALAAISMALAWTALSAVSQARPVRHIRA